MTQPAQPPDSSTTGKHIPALDGIRGLAVLMVMYFHFMWASMYTGHNPLIWAGAALKNIGWVGVDLFFALSGFLITGILYDTRRSSRFFRNFYARRSLRIFPLYYAVLFSSVLLGVWLGGVVGWWGLLETVTYTRNLIFPNATTIPAIWQPPNGSVMQLNHFWSLAIEEQFYFVWPLLVYLLQSRRKIAIACVLGIVASFSVRLALLHHGYLEQYPYLLSSWTPSRLDGLFGGALLAMVVRSRWETAVLKWSWIGVVGSFVGLCLLGRRYPYLNYLKYHEAGLWVYPLLALLFVSTIACSLRSGALLNRFFALPVMRFFGRYSYGLYVYHYTIAGMVEKLRPAVAQATGSKMLGVALPAMLGLGMTVVISMASFHWFEARFLRLKRKFEDHTHTPKLEEYVKAG